MAQDLEKLVVQLSADVKKYENALNRALNTTNKQMGAIEKRVRSGSKNISTGLAGLGKLAAGAFVGSAVVGGAIKFSEAATRIDNSLKIAGPSGEKLEKVYNALRDSAVRNAAPLESLVELYSRASLVQKELGVSSDQLIQFTDNIALALRVSGKTAQQSSGALLQLSQALGSGVVRAEEFNSIVEGAPTILQAAAAGIREAGGSVAKLRAIMLDGQLSSKALFDGIAAGSSTLAEKVQGSQITFGQAMENLKTALIDTAREFNTTTGASDRFAGGINNLASTVSNFDVSGFLAKIQSVDEGFQKFLNNVGNSDVFVRLNQALGLMDESGKVINPDIQAANDKTAALEREVKDLQANIEKNTTLGFDTTEALSRLAGVKAVLDQLRGQAASIPATLPKVSDKAAEALILQQVPFNPLAGTPNFGGNTISINDPKYKSPTTPKAAKGARDVKKTADDRINEDVQDMRDRTAAMAEEAAMIGKSYEEQERRKISLELEQSALADLREAARNKGVTDLESIKLSETQRANIDAVSAAYAKQADELRKVQETQDRAEQASSDFYESFKSNSIDAIKGAENLGDALGNLADKLGDVLLNSAFDAIFKPSSGGSGGGALGGIFEGIGKFLGFASGGYTGQGGKYEPAGVVHKGEYVFDAETTKRIGVDNLRKMQGYAKGGLVGAPSMPTLRSPSAASSVPSITYAPVIDARGADSEAVSRLEQVMARQQREFSSKVLKSMKTHKQTRAWP